jgi:hypothetical protein
MDGKFAGQSDTVRDWSDKRKLQKLGHINFTPRIKVE